MKYLYAPWRTSYTQNVSAIKKEGIEEKECIFCTIAAENNDAKHFLMRRFTHHFIILNLFPYNAGHLLIIPFTHKAHLDELSKDARRELIELTAHSSSIVKTILEADGINIGINLGKAAGAGIPSHLHMHVLPRWNGDTSFLPVLAETKSISVDLVKIYNQLKPAFDAVKIDTN